MTFIDTKLLHGFRSQFYREGEALYGLVSDSDDDAFKVHKLFLNLCLLYFNLAFWDSFNRWPELPFKSRGFPGKVYIQYKG